MPKLRRTFTREFKIQAVKFVTEQGLCFAEAVRQLGIRHNLLRLWKSKIDAEGTTVVPGECNRSAIDAELVRLRAENQRLQMDRDILRKAAAFFAREST